jgi:hypothetical protein
MNKIVEMLKDSYKILNFFGISGDTKIPDKYLTFFVGGKGGLLYVYLATRKLGQTFIFQLDFEPTASNSRVT